MCAHHVLSVDWPILCNVLDGLLCVVHHHARCELHDPILVCSQLPIYQAGYDDDHDDYQDTCNYRNDDDNGYASLSSVWLRVLIWIIVIVVVLVVIGIVVIILISGNVVRILIVVLVVFRVVACILPECGGRTIIIRTCRRGRRLWGWKSWLFLQIPLCTL